MNYAKIDAALASALGEQPVEADRSLLVSIRLERAPEAGEQSSLEQLGIDAQRAGVVSATVSPRDVDVLSEMPSVRSIRLSRKLRLAV